MTRLEYSKKNEKLYKTIGTISKMILWIIFLNLGMFYFYTTSLTQLYCIYGIPSNPTLLEPAIQSFIVKNALFFPILFVLAFTLIITKKRVD